MALRGPLIRAVSFTTMFDKKVLAEFPLLHNSYDSSLLEILMGGGNLYLTLSISCLYINLKMLFSQRKLIALHLETHNTHFFILEVRDYVN